MDKLITVSPNKVLALAETLVEEATKSGACQCVVIVRYDNHISIRDNSRIEGLIGDGLHDKITALMKELYP